MQAFGMALQRGDVDALAKELADDAEFLSDGGGVVSAVPQPLHGGALIAKTLIGFTRTIDWTRLALRAVTINGLPGGVLYDRVDGTVIQTLAMQLDTQGRIASIYVMRNPHKLAHLQPRH